MDYETKAIKRSYIRELANVTRKVFGLNGDDEPFPILYALENLFTIIPNARYEIIEDDDFPNDKISYCEIEPNGDFVIILRKTIYDEAYDYDNIAFQSFICHEICHLILFAYGFTPIYDRPIKDYENVPICKRVEWQAKALCGEITIPYEATRGMGVKEIVEKYHVTEASAIYRVNLYYKNNIVYENALGYGKRRVICSWV